MRKLVTKRNILVLVGILVVVGIWWRGKTAAAKKAASEEKIVAVDKGEVKATLQISGEIEAENLAILNYSGTGKIAYMGVKEGVEVKKWQLMAYLDPGDLQATERKAYYAYLAADAYAKLIEDQVKGHDGDETYTQKNSRVAAQTARDSAYDTWLTAQRTYNNSKLIAPFAGIVTNITATAVGDTATITDGLTVVDPTSLYFSGEIDEADVGKINSDMEVEVKLDAFPEQKFKAKIGEIGFVAKLSSTGATIFPVKLKLGEELLGKLRIGMNGDAEIILARKQNVLRVPIEAVIDGEVVKAGNGEKKVKIESGLEGDTEIEIVSGLNEGEKILVK